MSKFVDRTGQKFGKWTVLKFENVKGRSHWWCECECGAIKRVATSSLTRGISSRCRECYMPEDVTAGDKFGSWTIVSRSGSDGNHTLFKCECSCGNTRNIRINDLRRDKSKKCKECCTTHNMTQTMFYRVWTNMKQRCDNPKHKAFHNYGQRNISVCSEWYDFDIFFNDMHESYEAHKKANKNNTSLERIDNNKGYCESNCTWATKLEQANNQRQTIRFQAVKPGGETVSVQGMCEFCREYSLTRSAVYRCLRAGGSHKGWKFYHII